MKNQNISLNEVKNSAFLANASYGNVGGDKKDDLPNLGGTITNPATNSSFEVFNQKNEITNINVIGEVELGFNNI